MSYVSPGLRILMCFPCLPRILNSTSPSYELISHKGYFVSLLFSESCAKFKPSRYRQSLTGICPVILQFSGSFSLEQVNQVNSLVMKLVLLDSRNIQYDTKRHHFSHKVLENLGCHHFSLSN